MLCEENGIFFIFFLQETEHVKEGACSQILHEIYIRIYAYTFFECLWEGIFPHETWPFLADLRKYVQIATHHAILNPIYDCIQKGDFFIILAYAHLKAISSLCTKFVSELHIFIFSQLCQKCPHLKFIHSSSALFKLDENLNDIGHLSLNTQLDVLRCKHTLSILIISVTSVM